jgi:hypothetical protein
MQRLIEGTPNEIPHFETQHENGAGQSEPPHLVLRTIVPDYAMLYFDHLYSEYLTLKFSLDDSEFTQLLEEIHRKRLNATLTWSDIYTFDLALVDVRPPEYLIRKAYDARSRYRSIAGQKEYDEYLASKPPDLAAIRIAPDEEPPQPLVIIQRWLRADIKYLLSKFYLYYAMLPVREGLREHLTSRAVRITFSIVGAIILLIILNLGGVLVLQKVTTKFGDLSAVLGLTLATVALAGIIGGCVSMLQRIQSAPSEGDALFNLAALSNGWRGLSLSPLYGGIFASLLFVLFAAGILRGSVFPRINTPATIAAQIALGETELQKPAEQGTNAAGQTNVASNTPANPPRAAVVPPADSEILQIKDFIRQTGPADGVSYALLIIWSFIAGFAERLVPDTLNRLVAKNEAIQGTNT